MTRTAFDASWTREEALQLIDKLFKPAWAAGYFIGLAGSVLTSGRSKKDVDIVLAPLSTAKLNEQGVKDVLREVGLTPFVSKEEVHAQWRKLGSHDEKHVEVWLYGRKRVDLFFLK